MIRPHRIFDKKIASTCADAFIYRVTHSKQLSQNTYFKVLILETATLETVPWLF